MKLVVLLLLVPVLAAAKDSVDPRLREVKTIFVAGNNPAAEKVRSELGKSKSCLQLATNAKQADGTLEVADLSTSGGLLTGENMKISATLTLTSGDLIWSRTRRDGHMIYFDLNREACGR